MSKIYEALIQAGKSASRAASFRNHSSGEAALPPLSHLDNHFEWKLIGAVATVILFFGLLVVVIADQFMGRALQSENDQRALAIATNLSDAAAGPIMEKNILALYALLTKYARLNGSAYAFIEDNNGQIVAHSIRPFPPELQQTLTADERKQVNSRSLTLAGKGVHETRVPILEGQLGAAHLGIWTDGIKNEIFSVRLAFIGLAIVGFLVAVSTAVFLVRAILAPIHGPASPAAELSTGELKGPIENEVAR